MNRHIERIQLAETLFFSAVCWRDVPFNVPSFGDAGQMFDPFVYPGLLAAKTQRIALQCTAQHRVCQYCATTAPSCAYCQGCGQR